MLVAIRGEARMRVEVIHRCIASLIDQSKCAPGDACCGRHDLHLGESGGTSKRDNSDNRPCMYVLYSTIVEVELKICVTFSVWPDVAL